MLVHVRVSSRRAFGAAQDDSSGRQDDLETFSVGSPYYKYNTIYDFTSILISNTTTLFLDIQQTQHLQRHLNFRSEDQNIYTFLEVCSHRHFSITLKLYDVRAVALLDWITITIRLVG